jgi:hypothetical protein
MKIPGSDPGNGTWCSLGASSELAVLAFQRELGRAFAAATPGAGLPHVPTPAAGRNLPHLLDNARCRELIDGGKRKAQPVEVKARQFPKSMVLEVLSFRGPGRRIAIQMTGTRAGWAGLLRAIPA